MNIIDIINNIESFLLILTEMLRKGDNRRIVERIEMLERKVEKLIKKIERQYM